MILHRWFTRSIRRTLVLGLSTVLLVVGAISATFSYRGSLLEANELFDAKLAHSARLLRSLLAERLSAHAHGEPAAPPMEINVWATDMKGVGDELATKDGHAYETRLAFQVWSPDGRLLLRSTSAPNTPIAPLKSGFATIRGPVTWRCFTLHRRGLWFQAGEDIAIRGELARDIALGALWPALLALPLAGVLVWLFVGFGMRTLTRIADQVQIRSPTRLDPVSTTDVPVEILGLIRALNSLMGQVDAALEREKRFTADAAHELRTPLAGLQIHAENLVQASDQAERAVSAAGLRAGVERIQRLLTQLLELARLEPQSALKQLEPLELGSYLVQQVSEFAQAEPAAAERIVLRCPAGPQLIRAEPFALAVLLRNLLDNALRYGPDDGEVLVEVENAAGTIRLSVEDQGPGIPEQARERVLERFHRELGSNRSGSGLGLSIVKRIADLHHASLSLGSSGARGLRVTVQFAKH